MYRNMEKSLIIQGNYEIWISQSFKYWALLESRGEMEPDASVFANPFEISQAYWEKKAGYMLVYLPYNIHTVIAVRIQTELLELTEDDLLGLSTGLYPYYSEASLKQQEVKLNKMMESIREVTQSVDLDELLSKILTNALSVIPYETIGVLWMYDPAIGRLKVRAKAGEIGKEMLKMAIKPDEGMIGKTFRRGTPKLYRDFDEILIDFGDMTEENVVHLTHAYDFVQSKSIVTVPILVHNKPECVLIVYQTGKKPLLTEQDMQLLQGFADQVSIAITNARLFEDLRRQNLELRRRDEIHASLVKLSLQNKGAASIASELSKMIGLPLIYVDLLENKWHPERKRGASGLSGEELLRLYAREQGPSYRQAEESGNSLGKKLFCYPIVASSACLGYLLVELAGGLDSLRQIAIEQGASVLALELLRKQSLSEFYYKKTQDTFLELLHAKNPDVWREKADLLGIDTTLPLMVAVSELSSPVPSAELNLHVYRFVIDLREALGQQILVPVIFASGNKVTIVLQSRKNEAAVLKRFRSFLASWEQYSNLRIRTGAGSFFKDLHAAGSSHGEADKALSYLAARGSYAFMLYSDIGLNRLFIRHPKEELEAFVREIFEPLQQAKSQGAGLTDTLLTYMASDRSASLAADKLHIHINTLYLRLRKIEDLLGLSFDDPENVLRIQLACYLKQSSRE
ncbi:helix-turn-helix domain-containing protein [Paenibacillus sp. MMO-177]|uniref:helix-turn-helix domain-containing protein n=1 Tax=Paenibacillus sp. MMO-177 TaxID=3081289 RepID=UPI003017E5E7